MLLKLLSKDCKVSSQTLCVLNNASYASQSHGSKTRQVEEGRQDTIERCKSGFCTSLVAGLKGCCLDRICTQVALQDHYARMLQIPGAKLKPASLKPVRFYCLKKSVIRWQLQFLPVDVLQYSTTIICREPRSHWPKGTAWSKLLQSC